MKVALQFSGQLRQFEAYYFLYKMQLLDTLHPDIFVSTWKTKEPQRQNDEKDINAFSKLYHPLAVELQDFDTILQDDTQLSRIMEILKSNKDLHTYRSYKNILYMAYKRYRCNKLYQQYTQDHDMVVLTRTDLILCEPLLPKHLEVSDSHLLIPAGADFENGICDIMAIGPPHLITAYCDLYRMLPIYVLNKIKLHPEHILKYHLHYLQIPYKRISYNIYLNYRRMT